jgi:hypothetical protein
VSKASKDPISKVQSAKTDAGISETTGQTFDFTKSHRWLGNFQVLDLCTKQRVVAVELLDGAQTKQDVRYEMVAFDHILAGLGQIELTDKGREMLADSSDEQLLKLRASLTEVEESFMQGDINKLFRDLGSLYISMFDYRNQLAQSK